MDLDDLIITWLCLIDEVLQAQFAVRGSHASGTVLCPKATLGDPAYLPAPAQTTDASGFALSLTQPAARPSRARGRVLVPPAPALLPPAEVSPRRVP
jgi:hypothetical protein